MFSFPKPNMLRMLYFQKMTRDYHIRVRGVAHQLYPADPSDTVDGVTRPSTLKTAVVVTDSVFPLGFVLGLIDHFFVVTAGGRILVGGRCCADTLLTDTSLFETSFLLCD